MQENLIYLDDENDATYEFVNEDEELIPESFVLNDEKHDVVYSALVTLPPKRRETLLMYYYMNMSIPEIAKATGQTAQTASSVLAKARKDLATKLKGEQWLIAPTAAMSQNGLGAILSKTAETMFTPDVAASISEMARTATTTAAGVAAGAPKLIAWIVAACGVATIGTTIGLTIFGGDDQANAIEIVTQPPSQVVSIAPSEITKDENGEVYLEGDCDCGHVNPHEARLEGNSASEDMVSYEITDSGGIVIFTGNGTDASTDVRRLTEEQRYGEYTLIFNIDWGQGVVVHKSRNFNVMFLEENETIQEYLQEET